jgi:hypothetical protein
MLRQRQRIGWVAALGLAVTTPVAAETPVDIGILTCALAEIVVPAGAPIDDGATTEQVRSMLCWFRPFHEGPEETYLGAVRGAGQVRDLFKRRVIIWTVTGTTTTRASPGLLQQTYAVAPEAASGDAPPLIGKTRTELVLQPFTDNEPPVLNKKVQPLDAIVTDVELVLKSSPG